ncbi:hypothetical protein KC571_04065 [candidate division WWE3 bacterium]|uniref:Uncharacterized protein n=1 Tax=candidate division WWE3 bacterium TaxID=2053526 RepID=A0A955LHK3_UNCKA|nr:hypothetical protein [candidate division WWE3 bacterium]
MGFELSLKQKQLLQSFTNETLEKDEQGQIPEQKTAPISKTHEHAREVLALQDQLRTAQHLKDEARIQEIQAEIAAMVDARQRQEWAEDETAGTGGKFQQADTVERTTFAQGTKQMGRNNMPDRE